MSHFCRKKVIILSLHGQNAAMDIITFPKKLLITSGFIDLLHGVISLSDATSCDKKE